MGNIVNFWKKMLKHYIKVLLRRPDPEWDFYVFEKRIHPQTWKRHGEILDWAHRGLENAKNLENPVLYKESSDPIVRQGYTLCQEVKRKFKEKHRSLKELRVLIHLPTAEVSPSGYSFFNNLIYSLNYMGISAKALEWHQQIGDQLREFRPTVLLTCDYAFYTERIDWDAVGRYRKNNDLKIGLSAEVEEDGNAPLLQRLEIAKKHEVDFYYSFRSPECLNSREEYKPFLEKGYDIFSVEFGANPIIHYPVPQAKKDIDYIFLASSNPSKFSRYYLFLEEIFTKYPGFIHGPGWSISSNFRFIQDRDRYLYSRAKVGINLHIDSQIEYVNELNERTYMLAACGIPQLVDNPKLLPFRFSPDCLFIANDPKEYVVLFEEMLNDPGEAQRRALNAQREVFEKYTIFHNVENLVLKLAEVFHISLNKEMERDLIS